MNMKVLAFVTGVFLAALSCLAALSITDVQVTPLSPWGMAVEYTVEGTLPQNPDDYGLYVQLSNRTSHVVSFADDENLCGDRSLTLGRHRILWNASKDVSTITAALCTISVGYATADFCMISLDAGPQSSTYSVRYLPSQSVRPSHPRYKDGRCLLLKKIPKGDYSWYRGRNSFSTNHVENPFYLAVYEVTQGQYENVMGSNPSYFLSQSNPVERVSYNEICEEGGFLARLRARTGLAANLPTPIQWKYACFCGLGMNSDRGYYPTSISTSPIPYTNPLVTNCTYTVGCNSGNRWGFCNMLGNVAEWCSNGSAYGGGYRDKDIILIQTLSKTSQLDSVGFRPVIELNSSSDTAYHVLCSGASNVGTFSVWADGSSITGGVNIQYASLFSRESVVTLQADQLSTLLSATNRGSVVWQPQTKGFQTLSFISGTNAIACTLNVEAFDFWTQPDPNPPMDEDSLVSITPLTRSFPVNGGGAAITTAGSGTWTAVASDDWISLNASTGRVGYAVAYMVNVNTNVESRVGYIYVSGHTFTIAQEGRGATVIQENRTFECAGGTKTVPVQAEDRMSWKARPNVDWISVSPTEGSGAGSITYHVAPFHDVAKRIGTLTIAGNIYEVIQYGRRIKLGQYEQTCDYYTHVIPVTVNALAETTWVVRPNASWISIVDGGSGRGGDSVTIAVAENPSYLDRVGTVSIGTETFVVTQKGRTNLQFSVSPMTTTASVNGANGLLSVLATPDLPWCARSQANWLTVQSKFSEGAGNGNIVFVASPNSKLYQRVGSITVTPEAASGVPSKTVQVTQPAAESALSSSEYDFSAAGESTSVDVTVANVVEWSIENTNAWLRIAGATSRVGPGTVSMEAIENATVYPRRGVVMIAGKTFIVSQRGQGVDVEYDNRLFSTAGEDASLSVHPNGNSSWTAVASDPTWIIIWGNDFGTGDGEVLFIISGYEGDGTPRTGTITVGDKTVYVTQRPYDLDIDPKACWVDGNAGEGEVGVSAPIGKVWNAISTEPWITVISGYDQGSGSGTVRYSFMDNDTGKTRTGRIIISGEAYTLTQEARIIVSATVGVEGCGTVSGAGQYSKGSNVKFSATAAAGYAFSHWLLPDGTHSLANPLQLTMDASKELTAVFLPFCPEFSTVESSSNGVRLVWTPLAWAVEYAIYRSTTDRRPSSPLATVPGTDCSYMDDSGLYGIAYNYWVEAIGATERTICQVPASGQRIRPIVVSPIIYENLQGASHSNPSSYTNWTSVVFTAPKPRDGYTFTGWTPSSITAEMSGPQTITANWTANTYGVEFNPNGGTGSMPRETLIYDVSSGLTDNAFSRPGFTFQGWATASNGEVVYADGQSVSNLLTTAEGVVQLYAVWKLKNYSMLVGADAGSKDLEVSVDDWTVVSSNTWLSASRAVADACRLTVSVEANTGCVGRVGTLLVGSVPVTVIQQNSLGGEVSLESSIVDGVSAAGTNKVSVGVRADDAWHVSSLSDWLSLDGLGQGQGEGTLAFSVMENPLFAHRVGSLRVVSKRYAPDPDLHRGLQFWIRDQENIEGNDTRRTTLPLGEELVNRSFDLVGAPLGHQEDSAFTMSFSFKVGGLGYTNHLFRVGNQYFYLTAENELECRSGINDAIQRTGWKPQRPGTWYTLVLRHTGSVVSFFAGERDGILELVHQSNRGVYLDLVNGVSLEKWFRFGRTERPYGILKAGQFADIRFWSRALSDAECLAVDVLREDEVRDVGSPGTSLQNASWEYFPLRGNALGISDSDATLSTFGAYLTGWSSAVDRDGVSRSALQSSGEGQVVISNFGSLFATSETNAAYSVWIRADSWPTDSDALIWERVINNGSSNTNILRISLSLTSQGRLRLYTWGQTASQPFDHELSTNVWHMITVSGMAGGSTSVYVDGELIGSGTTAAMMGNFSSAAYARGCPSALVLGGWDGAVGGLTIFHRPLTAMEIAKLYEQQRRQDVECTVWQKGQRYQLKFEPDWLELDAVGSFSNLTISASDSVGWTISSLMPWFTLEDGIGTGDGIVSFAAGENTSCQERGGVLIAKPDYESADPDIHRGLQLWIRDQESVEGNEPRRTTLPLGEELDGKTSIGLAGAPLGHQDDSAFSLAFSFKVGGLDYTNHLFRIGNQYFYLTAENELESRSGINDSIQSTGWKLRRPDTWYTLVLRHTGSVASLFAGERGGALELVHQANRGVFLDLVNEVSLDRWFRFGRTERPYGILKSGQFANIRFWARALSDTECTQADVLCDGELAHADVPGGVSDGLSWNHYPLQGNAFYLTNTNKMPSVRGATLTNWVAASDRFDVPCSAVKSSGNGRVVIPDFGGIFAKPESNVAYSVWIRVDSWPTDSDAMIWERIVDNGTSNTNILRLSLSLTPQGHLRFASWGQTNIASPLDAVLTTNDWHMITVSGQAGVITKVFVDGEYGGGVQVGPVMGNYDSVGYARGCPSSLVIGGWDGALEDLTIFHRPLNSTEVFGLYERQRALKAFCKVVQSGMEDPIPDLGADPTPREIASALEGSADEGLSLNIVDGTTYNAYREWASMVKSSDGKTLAGHRLVKDSALAWLSFALNTSQLISSPPKQDDLRLVDFNVKPDEVSFSVSLNGVEIGRSALVSNLRKVFATEGAYALNGAFASSLVEVVDEYVEGGCVRFKIRVKGDTSTRQFFLRVVMSP